MSAARPTVLQDDAATRITRWDFEPHANTGWHVHEWPYFVVMLTDASLELNDGKQRTDVARRAGDSYRRPAGVAHDVRNRSEHATSFVEIEIKDPSSLLLRPRTGLEVVG
jgi:beta-alanine degradation protein BauB